MLWHAIVHHLLFKLSRALPVARLCFAAFLRRSSLFNHAEHLHLTLSTEHDQGCFRSKVAWQDGHITLSNFSRLQYIISSRLSLQQHATCQITFHRKISSFKVLKLPINKYQFFNPLFTFLHPLVFLFSFLPFLSMISKISTSIF